MLRAVSLRASDICMLKRPLHTRPTHPKALAGLVNGVLAGERLQLARAITLVESQHPDDHKQADLLLDQCSPLHDVWRAQQVLAARRAQGATGCIRIGIAGPPGAGKSTFIEALGLSLLQPPHDHRVAVITVDPSSLRSGGSILGDKTRMDELARSPQAFIRGCPSRGVLGGIAQYTNDVVSHLYVAEKSVTCYCVSTALSACSTIAVLFAATA
eukprot:6892-Heterococcus_DN1.PRE.3